MGTKRTPPQVEPAPKNGRERAVASPRTEGQRLLLAAGTGAEVVTKTGLAKGAVSEWRSGKKVPGPSARAKLASALQIPVPSWDRAPGPPAPPLPDPDDNLLDEDAEADGSAASMRESPRLALKAHVEDIKRSLALPGLAEGERTKRMGVYTHALRALGQAEQDEALLESRIVLEHPGFQRAAKTIMRILKPHPELAIEVAEALALEEAEVARG